MEISLCGQHKGLKGEGGASRKGAFRWRLDPALRSEVRAGKTDWAFRASRGESWERRGIQRFVCTRREPLCCARRSRIKSLFLSPFQSSYLALSFDLPLAFSLSRSPSPSLRRYPLFGDSMYIGALVEGRRHGFGKQVRSTTPGTFMGYDHFFFLDFNYELYFLDINYELYFLDMSHINGF